jgi:hypothetical protein
VAKTAINPATYWSAFRFWSFPFPVDRVPNLGSKERSAALVVMVCGCSLAGAIPFEWSAAEPPPDAIAFNGWPPWLALDLRFPIVAGFALPGHRASAAHPSSLSA